MNQGRLPQAATIARYWQANGSAALTANRLPPPDVRQMAGISVPCAEAGFGGRTPPARRSGFAISGKGSVPQKRLDGKLGKSSEVELVVQWMGFHTEQERLFEPFIEEPLLPIPRAPTLH